MPRTEIDALLEQREAIVAFGRMALQSSDLNAILTEACRLTSRALETELAKVMELREDGQSLRVVAGVGWQDGIVGEETVPALQSSSEGFALATGKPVVSESERSEERFDYADFLKRHGVKAMVNVVIPGADGQRPYGLLQVDSTKPRDFSKNDVEFLQSYANLVGAAVDRHVYSERLAESLRVQERLFDELQHRVKNNIATIASILRMKARRTANPAVKTELADVISRIEVLAELHRNLAASSRTDRVDLGGYLSAIVSNVAAFSEVTDEAFRLEVDADRVQVGSDMAIPLGLVANEFVTNSLKHGSRTDEIVLTLRLTE
ncbi:MAG: GAF domain-containing protein [Alphaproteobacteria bacterium]|nr:GAF domain-containing protein [Alphaproteobacteria bacterium]